MATHVQTLALSCLHRPAADVGRAAPRLQQQRRAPMQRRGNGHARPKRHTHDWVRGGRQMQLRCIPLPVRTICKRNLARSDLSG
jgi:hypothetical protein